MVRRKNEKVSKTNQNYERTHLPEYYKSCKG